MNAFLKLLLDWLWGKVEELLAKWKREQDLVKDTAEKIAKQSEDKANEIQDAIRDNPRDPDDSSVSEKLRTGRF